MPHQEMQGNKKFGFIYVIITIDGEPAEISTKNKVEVQDWNYSQKRVNGRSLETKSINEKSRPYATDYFARRPSGQ
ncbi:MAG: hypothetical protein EOO00_11675 [Chitinophagaceae bacterium]|nr:MAG: hypothetical protein EOO00_11675 [Chitinophagaceae bacterium]